MKHHKQIHNLATFVLVLIAICTACGDDSPHEEREERVVTTLTPNLAPVVEGNNAFALDLYREVAAHESSNILLSPFSISSALGMTYAGAQDETAQQMKTVLHIDTESDIFHRQLSALTRDLHGDKGRGYTLRIANRLFGQQGFPIEDPFMELIRNDYGAGFQELDFQEALESARQNINAWVADETEEQIPELLGPDSITIQTRLVLANAVYFKGGWATPFSTDSSYTGPFTRSDGSIVNVNIMQGMDSNHRLSHFEGGRAVELNYQDNELSMLILLPDSDRSLAELESNLTPEWLGEVISQLSNTGGFVVGLPSWETNPNTNLAEPLKAMGMTDAFEPIQANFDGISKEGSLYIQTIAHETYIKVDEQGTTAAAGTAVVISDGSATKPFVVNRPFVYIIRDRLTDSLLFIGRLEDPSAG